MGEDYIKIGDVVNVHIPNRVICSLKVLYIPEETDPMGNWRFKDLDGKIIYLLHYCTIEQS